MITPAITEFVTFISNIALTLSVLVAVIFGMAQVRAAARDRHERLTLETLRNFQTREFAELMHHVNMREMPKTGPELRALPVEQQVLFIQLAQQMESLGILVAEMLVNIDLVDKTLGSFVTSAWGEISAGVPGHAGEIARPLPGRIFPVAGRGDRQADAGQSPPAFLSN